MRWTWIAISAALLTACGRQEPQNQATANAPAAAPVAVNQVAPEPVTNAAPAEPVAPLAEPKGAIDPKSVEAAGQVVQHYGALIEQKRWAEAGKLWGNPDSAADFARQLGDRTVHMEIGELGETEGAAGSIYTTVPVTFTGDARRRSAEVILRRVNDVPGSTAAQRRWHIERIEWKPAG